MLFIITEIKISLNSTIIIKSNFMIAGENVVCATLDMCAVCSQPLHQNVTIKIYFDALQMKNSRNIK